MIFTIPAVFWRQVLPFYGDVWYNNYIKVCGGVFMRVFNIFKRKQISENQTQCTQHHGPAYYEEQKVKDLEHVLTIESDGYNATTLYVHRLTNQPYIIHKTLEQYGAGCYDAYHKITLSTYKIINQMLAIRRIVLFKNM